MVQEFEHLPVGLVIPFEGNNEHHYLGYQFLLGADDGFSVKESQSVKALVVVFLMLRVDHRVFIDQLQSRHLLSLNNPNALVDSVAQMWDNSPL